ncbi:MAG: hypothetical protein JO033_22815 [Acidobacteriaceae bacterium]|nr:hypothetical protein [Acidobacteriaceae bacterium]
MNKRFLVIAAALLLSRNFCPAATFRVIGADARPWSKILGSVGISHEDNPESKIVVAGGDSTAPLASLAENQIVIVEGLGHAARDLGFKLQEGTVSVRQIRDVHAPNMQVIWQQPKEVNSFELPANYQIFATERWKNLPVLVGKRTAHGAILWMATPPGESGFERYPYLLHALVDLGLPLPLESEELWAFFDSPYRIRADLDYLAKRWRKAGVSVLHVAAWHNMEPDPTQDEFLKRLIEACHRNAILVYAWLELPHVSEKFWADHPAWREKTAVGQDAQLDWRKLMDLQNPECKKAAAAEVAELLGRFDWDGVNVAELYFESLEGASNPARFTPMNDDVRADFKRLKGFDPKLLFDPSSQYAAPTHPECLREFLDYRAGLASRMQAEWLDMIDRSRASKPFLDVVLTHIDDRFEPDIRDALGADVARSLPLIKARRATLLVEDPATLWDLGPDRYRKLGTKYQELSNDARQFAIDINVVERYQDVYPTKKQTGVELFELVHQAASSFGRVALYFENSLEKQDLRILPAAAATAQCKQISADELQLTAFEPTRVAWQGPVEVDGRLWPVQNSNFVLAPAGKHILRAAVMRSPVTIADFNGDIHSASVSQQRIELSYSARSRALAVVNQTVSAIEVDGAGFPVPAPGEPVALPAGQHTVSFTR